MRVSHSRVAFLLGLLALPLASQPPSFTVCHGLNHRDDRVDGELLMPAFPGFNGNEIAIFFVVPRTLTIAGAELYYGTALSNGSAVNQVPYGTLQIRSDAGGVPGGLLSGSGIAASMPYAVQGQLIGWRRGVFSQSVTLLANQAAWLSFYDFYGNAQNVATQLEGSTDATPYVTSFGNPTPQTPMWSAVQLDRRFKVRLLGTGCPPVATATTVGGNWPGGVGPYLNATGPAVPGAQTFGLVVSNAPPATSVALIWALGTDPVGTPVAAGPRLHLDLASTLALFSTGQNPRGNGVTSVLGLVSFPLQLPGDPALLGATLAYQAAVFDPGGAVIGPGLGLTMTQAVEVTLGW